jgi:ABC-2 type transport system ATP-binding protein
MSDIPLQAGGVTRLFSGGAGVRDTDIRVAGGQVHALVGLNGAGKTTLMRLLLGMLRPSAGSVRIHGQPVDAAGPRVWAEVGHLVGPPPVYPELDVRTNLAVSARLRGVPASRVSSTVEDAMAEFGLERYAHTRSRTLSTGNRQRLGVAAALQHHPALIVLDEPTSALDPAGVILVREALQRRAGAGAGVLVSSHHLDEVARIAHPIAVVNRGRLIGRLDPRGVDIERAFFDLVHADDERGAV